MFGFSRALQKLPLIGLLIAGQEGDGVFGITFAVRGPLEQPGVQGQPAVGSCALARSGGSSSTGPKNYPVRSRGTPATLSHFGNNCLEGSIPVGAECLPGASCGAESL